MVLLRHALANAVISRALVGVLPLLQGEIAMRIAMSATARQAKSGRRPARLAGASALAAAAAMALAACSSGAASSATAASKPLTTVTLLGTGGASVVEAPLYLAKDSGIFARNGLNVEIDSPSSAGGATTVQFIQQGKYDLGYVSVDQLLDDRQDYGYSVVAFYGWLQKNARCIMVPKDENITKPSQLAGKTLAFVDTTNNTTNDDYLKHYGVYSDVKIELVSQAASTGVYLSGKVDGVAGYGFQQVPELTAGGRPTTDLCQWQAGMHYMQAVLGAKSSYITRHKTVMQELTASLTQALNEMAKNPMPAAKDLKASDQTGSIPAASVLAQEISLMLPYFKTPNDAGHEYGWMSPKDWQQTKTEGEQYFAVKASLNVAGAYTNEFTK
jgi:ABC-type nitrate/sulfonate/bicarbonate transport system substrate-binding protein